MTPERLQILRAVRDGKNPNAPELPYPIRRAAAEHIDAMLREHLLETFPLLILSPKGQDALDRAEAMLAHRAGTPVLGGAQLVRPGELAHADLTQMAQHLAGVCQAQVNAMPHGRINFAIVVHAGDSSQIPGAPAWAYATSGNLSATDRRLLLEEQLRVLREEEALERAAEGEVAPAVELVNCQGCNDKKWTPGVNAEGVKMQVPCPWCRP